MSTIIVMLLATALFLVPVLWQIRTDARRARADVIAADIRAALNHRFRGETYLSVHVTPRSFRHAGRVALSAPGGYEWLIEEGWRDVMSRTPAGYELVLKAGDATAANSPREAELRRLPRAA
jgi:hypothetical protein